MTDEPDVRHPDGVLTGLLDPATLTSLRRWFAASPSYVAVVPDVLAPELAASLATELATSPHWRSETTVRNSSGSIDDVPERDFVATPADRRFARLAGLPAEHWSDRPSLLAVVDALCDPRVAAALSAHVVGVPLAARPFLDVARFGRGDFLGEHSDAAGGRVVAVLLYVGDVTWRDGDGACFGYRNEDGEVQLVPPRHNTAAVMRFPATARHWVAPNTSTAFVRYAVTAHYVQA